MGPLPRPAGACEGGETRLTRRVLSPIIFSLSLSAASAQNLSVNGLEKSEAYRPSTYRNACEKGTNGIHGTNCVFKFQDAVLAVFVGRGAQPDPLRPHKEWLLLPMVNFNIRPLGGMENKEVKSSFSCWQGRPFFSRTDERSRPSSLRRKARRISAKTVLTPRRPTGIGIRTNLPARREGGTADRRRPPGRPGRE